MSPDTRRLQRGLTLVELLVVIAIMSIVSALVLVVWFGLGSSYSDTTQSSKAREYARDAVSRMAREIRDASQGPTGQVAFRNGGCTGVSITFYTTFNTENAADPASKPRLVRFYLSDSTLYREHDSDGDNVLDSKRVLATNVVNEQETGLGLFRYTYIQTDGTRTVTDGTTTAAGTLGDTTKLVSVEIRLLVDLNPGRSPQYIDLSTVVQPRNVRPT
jgi:prepilin-type N-terminal cleavage/methylation domain-containing protein